MNEKIVEFKRLKEENDDVSLLSFCEENELDYSTLYYHIKRKFPHLLSRKNNGKTKKSVESNYSKRKVNVGDLDEIKRLYFDEKLTFDEIGRIYNCDKSSIHNLFKANNVKCRSKQENNELRLQKDPTLRERFRMGGINSFLSQRKYGTKPERLFEQYCNSNNIKFISQYREVGNKHPYDFFLPEFNTLVEIDGSYWHSSQSQKEKDNKQVAEALQKGYNVIRITTNELNENNNDFSLWFRETSKQGKFNGRKQGRLLKVEY